MARKIAQRLGCLQAVGQIVPHALDKVTIDGQAFVIKRSRLPVFVTLYRPSPGE
jgi:hypothetical protein